MVVCKLWKSVHALDIAYMHTHQLCGRLGGGGGGGRGGGGARPSSVVVGEIESVGGVVKSHKVARWCCGCGFARVVAASGGWLLHPLVVCVVAHRLL